MQKLAIAQKITSGVAGLGAGIIIDRLIQDNVSEPEKRHERAAVRVGAFAMGAMVGDAVASYTNNAIEEIFAGVRRITAPKSEDDQ